MTKEQMAERAERAKSIAFEVLCFFDDMDPYGTGAEIDDNFDEILDNTIHFLLITPGEIVEQINDFLDTFCDEDDMCREDAQHIIDRIERL